jgi:hypothetical protein
MPTLRAIRCFLFHWGCYRKVPWGIHHYDCTCLKCGRHWDEFE